MTKKIYIADDYNSTRELLLEIVGESLPNYEVRAFPDGKSLLEAIDLYHDDIEAVVTDNNMPNMNGLDVIRKRSSLYPNINFILISGYSLQEEAVKAGAKHFFERPFDLEELVSSLSGCLTLSSQ
jgi:DNA-binding NtrC family response regulator